jgi:UDP-glucose 4-epimerase
VGVRLVVEQPIHTIETNVLETSAVLQFARDAGASGRGVPTFVASTSEVYGKGVRVPFREDDDVVYGATVHQRWSYACSKAIDEFLGLAYAREHSLPIVIGRLFNTVGPRQRGDYGMVLPRFVARALANEPIEVHGDGLQSRCFCDVRDVVPAIVQLMERIGGGSSASRDGVLEPSLVFNIGSDRLMTIEDLAELVKRVLGSESEIVRVPYDQAFGPGFEDMRTRQPDLTRIRATIGFEPLITLEQTIRDIAAEFVENPDSRLRVMGSQP